MIAPEKLTKQKLIKILVRKHKKFLEECQREFEILNKIQIIKEKQDLLEYWLSSSQNSKKDNNYLGKLEKVDGELEKLKEEFDSFSNGEDNNSENYLKNRHKWLKNKIQTEEKGVQYWRKKKGENG